MKALSGWKTYAVAALGLASAIAELFFGLDVPGISTSGDAVQVAMTALVAGGLRHAMPSKDKA